MTNGKVIQPTIHLINTKYNSPGVIVAVGLDKLLGGSVVTKSKKMQCKKSEDLYTVAQNLTKSLTRERASGHHPLNL